MDTIASLLDARERATAIYDFSLVCEIDAALARLGYGHPVFETAVAPTERAVPKRKPKR